MCIFGRMRTSSVPKKRTSVSGMPQKMHENPRDMRIRMSGVTEMLTFFVCGIETLSAKSVSMALL